MTSSRTTGERTRSAATAPSVTARDSPLVGSEIDRNDITGGRSAGSTAAAGTEGDEWRAAQAFNDLLETRCPR